MKLPSGWRRKANAIYWRHQGRELYLGSTLAAAHRKYAELLAREPTAEIHTVAQLLARYLAVHAPTKSAATQTMIRRACDTINPALGHWPLSAIRPATLYEYYERRSAKRSAKLEVGVLRHAFTCATQWGVLDRNPLLGQVRLPNAKPRRRYVTDDELRAFLRICTPWMRAYVDLKLLTGLAKEDLLSLRRDDVRDDGLHAYRRKTNTRPKVYPWDDAGRLQRAVDAVYSAQLGRVGSSWIFHTHAGQPYYRLDADGHRERKPSAFDSMWQRLMKRFVSAGGLRFTEHDLRAKVASDTDAAHAQALMDHATPLMTETVYRRGAKVVQIAPRRVGKNGVMPPEVG